MPQTKKGQRSAASGRLTRLQKRQKSTNNNNNTKQWENLDEDFPPLQEPEEATITTGVDDDAIGMSDEDTVVGGSNRRPPPLSKTRCTLKLKLTGGKMLMEDLLDS